MIKLAVSLGLLVILFSWVDIGELWRTIEKVNPAFLAVAVLLLVMQPVISTLKWKAILAYDGNRIPFLFLWKTYLIGVFLGLFLPTSFGGDVYRIYATRHSAGNLHRSASSVLFERLTGLFALITLSFIGSLFLPQRQIVWIVALLYLTSVGSFLAATSTMAISHLRRITSGWASFPARLLESFHFYRKSKPLLFGTLAISFWFQINVVIINFLYTRALGIDVPFTALLLVIPLIFLSEALPVSISGLGVRESAFAFFFVLIGQTREEGLAVALMVFLFRYLLGSVGGLLLFLDGLQVERSSRVDAQGLDLLEP